MPVELHRARVRVDSHVVGSHVEAVLEVRSPSVSGIRRDGCDTRRPCKRRRPGAGSHAGSSPGRDVFVDREDRQTHSDLGRGESSDRLHPRCGEFR